MRCLLTKLTLFNFPTEYCLHNANYVLLAFCTQVCLNNIFNKMFNLSKVKCSCFRRVHIFIVTDVGIIKVRRYYPEPKRAFHDSMRFFQNLQCARIRSISTDINLHLSP